MTTTLNNTQAYNEPNTDELKQNELKQGNLSLEQQTATVVITHQVKDSFKQQYENWLQEIMPIAKSYPGHLGVGIVYPVAGASITYTVIIRFDTRQHLLTWMQSESRKTLITKVRPYLVEADKFYVRSGLDFWFTPEGAKAKLPTKWKQFLITWSAIFPLVMIMSTLVDWINTHFSLSLHHELKVLSTTFLVVFMMVYIVMPRYTKLVHQWLFR